MGGRLHLKYLNTLLWSSKSKFKIWIRSEQWLLRYSTFNVGGPVGGWLAGCLTDNNATSWPHLASWDFSDLQLGWDFEIGPSVAITCDFWNPLSMSLKRGYTATNISHIFWFSLCINSWASNSDLQQLCVYPTWNRQDRGFFTWIGPSGVCAPASRRCGLYTRYFFLLLSFGLSAMSRLGLQLADEFKGRAPQWLLWVNSVWGVKRE